jgi:methylenetetrahydrofolate dehydrogenase (NADP+)/methenyltetrahydrofolate cyclohydrolase
MAQLIDGKKLAEDVVSTVKTETEKLVAATGVVPGIAVVIVGEDPASQVYVASKGRKAKECGFHSVQHDLPDTASEQELLDLIESLNNDPAIHGILVQLPLPKHIDSGRVIQTISPDKDVDGFHFINVGKLGTGEVDTAFVPCTPAGAMIMIERVHGRDLSGLNAVVIGRSNIVGKPMFNLLLAANATVTVAHSRTKDLPAIARTAPERGEGKTRLVGDVDFADAEKVAGAITPVPGGVGPMTIAMLMANTLTAACRSAGVKKPVF